eukprot:CAMPEP_0185733274 /NCGR_PEP_ID=MMETSP1171-20130828/18988_1 /TAXON_ID=374046 /ORGANISM="Helicotheca tamensis, Strain CCMP826" /LENGTH=143 /DNA_ID=CAMNT_0028402957 /DNA_START=167 /DNA_END=598 /DNA_ORIENTATION=+
MIKPDGVQRGLVGESIRRFEGKGYKLVAMKLVRPERKIFEEHYAEMRRETFFAGLIEYMISGPVVAMVWEGTNVILEGRKIVGATMPRNAKMGSIRGDFTIEVGRNVVHGADSPDSANSEINQWFPEGLVEWGRCSEPWVYED